VVKEKKKKNWEHKEFQKVLILRIYGRKKKSIAQLIIKVKYGVSNYSTLNN
jgi:hypothetical protein